jgi:hypothetical protein
MNAFCNEVSLDFPDEGTLASYPSDINVGVLSNSARFWWSCNPTSKHRPLVGAVFVAVVALESSMETMSWVHELWKDQEFGPFGDR